VRRGTIAFVALALVTTYADTVAARPGPLTPGELRTASPITPREVAAAFTHRSYRPGSWARLRVWARTRSLTVQIFACGPGPSARNYFGVAVTTPKTRPWTRSGVRRTFSIRVRSWPSGLYFARLTARDGRVGYAPFVLRPSRLGSARIAVVFPTNTWQAYNLRDMDADGVGDTWYADRSIHAVNLARPFLKPGMPRRFRYYDLPFIRWLYRHGKTADFYADDDFTRFRSGRWLARHYALVVFPGHEEYVTPRQYDLTTSYRNRGGNLAFLSANNFFYRVTRDGNRMYGRHERGARWRDHGRPEAALVGVQYVDWYQGIYDQEPYVVRGAHRARWLFAGTGLRNGDRFGRFGIEIDARAPSSPPRTVLLALAKEIFGPGKSAEMTYYRTSRGAKVFAAGALNFAARARGPIVDRLIANIFAKLEVR
jgi:hypothetical protein